MPDTDLDALGLLAEDQADLRRHAAQLSDEDRARVADLAARLSARVGDLELPWPRLFADVRDEPGRPMGLLPLLVSVVVDVPSDLDREEEELLRRFAEARGEAVAPPDTGFLGRIRSAFK